MLTLKNNSCCKDLRITYYVLRKFVLNNMIYMQKLFAFRYLFFTWFGIGRVSQGC